MTIHKKFYAGRLELKFSGELDHHDARDSMSYIEGLIDEYMPGACVIDLGKLEFMDSSGIAVILWVFKKMGEICGKTWVENPVGQPKRVLDAAGIDRVIRIYDKVR